MIDDVYRVVQIIANKNNYGVITPDRFNKLAKDVQLKIINELPDELRRAKNRYNTIRSAAKGTMDTISQIQNVLDIFITRSVVRREISASFPSGFTDYFALPSNLHYINSVWYQTDTKVEELDKSMAGYVRGSLLIGPTAQYPVYEKIGNNIHIYPSNIGLTTTAGVSALNDDISLVYQRIPVDPKWTYTTVSDKAVFNISDSTYQDFELPDYLFDRIVIDVAALVGIHLREQEVQQFTQQDQSDNFQRKVTN